MASRAPWYWGERLLTLGSGTLYLGSSGEAALSDHGDGMAVSFEKSCILIGPLRVPLRLPAGLRLVPSRCVFYPSDGPGGYARARLVFDSATQPTVDLSSQREESADYGGSWQEADDLEQSRGSLQCAACHHTIVSARADGEAFRVRPLPSDAWEEVLGCLVCHTEELVVAQQSLRPRAGLILLGPTHYLVAGKDAGGCECFDSSRSRPVADGLVPASPAATEHEQVEGSIGSKEVLLESPVRCRRCRANLGVGYKSSGSFWSFRICLCV